MTLLVCLEVLTLIAVVALATLAAPPRAEDVRRVGDVRHVVVSVEPEGA